MPEADRLVSFPSVRVLREACIPPLSGKGRLCKCTGSFSESSDIGGVFTRGLGRPIKIHHKAEPLSVTGIEVAQGEYFLH